MKSEILLYSNGLEMGPTDRVGLTEKLILTMFLGRQAKTLFARDAGGHASLLELS